MRSLRITAGLAVVACALCAMAAPAMAKEKAIFGEFKASITGRNLETSPGQLAIWKEDEPIVPEALTLGNYKFGPINRANGEIETNRPCEKIKVEGSVTKESSSELPATLKLIKCVSRAEAGGVVQEKKNTISLPVVFEANASAEITGMNIAQETVLTFKGALSKCPVTIPKQTIPNNVNPEKEYEEIVSYNSERPEEVERWEHSKKLKELFPTDEKLRLEIDLEEKFHGIRSFVKDSAPCDNRKGEESGHLVTEEGNPHKGELEFTNGKLEVEIEGLEVKEGNLSFAPAP